KLSRLPAKLPYFPYTTLFRSLVGQLLDPLVHGVAEAHDKVDHGLVDALVDQRDPRLGADEAERLLLYDAVAHAGVPFDGEVEGQPRLGAERGARPAGLARADSVHGAERPAERLGQIGRAHV